nr:hypothetical protein [Endozoicomonas arenosclerae]
MQIIILFVRLNRQILNRGLILFLSCFLTQVSSAGPGEEVQLYKPDYKNLVLMDAGSSGSRVMSYQFRRMDGLNQYELLRQTPLVESQTPLALKKLFPRALLEEMKRLYNLTVDGNFASTEVFVGGTAGLRAQADIIDISGRPTLTADLILMKLAIELYNHGLNGNYPENIRLLTGLEEAAFTWLGVNALKGLLDSESPQYGIIELGGGSVQMAFKVRKGADAALFVREGKATPKSAVNIKSFWRYPQPGIEVYGESHLGFGLNQAYDSMIRLEGQSLSTICENYEKCKKVVDKLFERPGALRKYRNRQSYHGYMPKTFYLNGYFYDRTVALGLPNMQTPKMIKAAARHVCDLSPGQLSTKLRQHYQSGVDFFTQFMLSHNLLAPVTEDFASSGEPRKVHAERLCAELIYMSELLNRLGLALDTRLLVSKSVKYKGQDFGLSWPLGYSIAWANEWLSQKE